jgi:hypothetical protein
MCCQCRIDCNRVIRRSITYRAEILDAHDIAELGEDSALGRARAGCEEGDLFRGWLGHGHVVSPLGKEQFFGVGGGHWYDSIMLMP